MIALRKADERAETTGNTHTINKSKAMDTVNTGKEPERVSTDGKSERRGANTSKSSGLDGDQTLLKHVCIKIFEQVKISF